jgi:uncharacterized membrane protein
VPTSRLEAFSDGVLAVIITIMVLELKVPHGPSLAALREAAGTGLLNYLLSFVYVGIYWTNHHHIFHLVRRVTGGILWANLGLLFFLSLLPYTTSWTDETDYARTPVVVYGVNLLAAGLAYLVLQTVIIRSEGSGSALKEAIGSDVKGKVSLALYLSGIACAVLGGDNGAGRAGTWGAIACYVAVAVTWVVPDRRIDRIVRARGDPD